MARPDVPVLGVVDYNPAGLVILSAFLLGGASGDEYAVPVQWLGMRRQQLAELGVQSQGAGGAMLRCLSDLDRSVLEGVRRKLADHGHLGWDDEAAEMAAFGRKVELECVLDAPGVSPAAPSGAVSRFLLHAALCRQYVSSS